MQPALASAPSSSTNRARLRGAAAGTAGLCVILLYGLQFEPLTMASVVALALLVGWASALVGALLGFLFGIPRTRDEDVGRPTPLPVATDGQTVPRRLPSYQANTNLEQISDWLTKILVGVGLTQMGAIARGLDDLSAWLAGGLGSTPTSRPFAVALVVFHLVAGFLIAYLWTRIDLPSALRLADRDALQQEKAVLQAEVRALSKSDSEQMTGVESEVAEAPPLDAAASAQVRAIGQRVRSLETSGTHLDAGAYRRLGLQLKRAGDYNEAVRAYLRAFDLEPSDPRPLNFAGVVHSKYLHQYDEAERLYRRALAIDPTYLSPVYNLACNAARRGDRDGAFTLLATAIAGDPKYRRFATVDADPGGPFHGLQHEPRFQALVADIGSSDTAPRARP